MMGHSKRLFDWSFDHLRVKIKTITTDAYLSLCVWWCIIFSRFTANRTIRHSIDRFHLFVSLLKFQKVLLAKKKIRFCLNACLFIAFIVVGLNDQIESMRSTMMMLIFGDYCDHCDRYCGLLLIGHTNCFEIWCGALVFFSHSRLKTHPRIDQYHTREYIHRFRPDSESVCF